MHIIRTRTFDSGTKARAERRYSLLWCCNNNVIVWFSESSSHLTNRSTEKQSSHQPTRRRITSGICTVSQRRGLVDRNAKFTRSTNEHRSNMQYQVIFVKLCSRVAGEWERFFPMNAEGFPKNFRLPFRQHPIKRRLLFWSWLAERHTGRAQVMCKRKTLGSRHSYSMTPWADATTLLSILHLW